jgi:hypothetical protein
MQNALLVISNLTWLDVAEVNIYLELFLHAAEVHICLVIRRNGSQASSWPRSVRPKTRFLPFSIRLNMFSSGRNRKLKTKRIKKVMRLLCQYLQRVSESLLGRYAVHRNHGAIACARTPKQHLSSRWLPPRGWMTTSARIVRSKAKNDNFDPASSSRARYGVQLNVERVPVWIVCLDL